MTEIAGALISIVLVLVAVFLPVAFLGGVTGTLYQQFAVTIAISVVISGVMALTLSPALAAIIIKAHHGEKKGFFRWFENGFERLTDGYVGGVARLIQGWPIALLAFGAVIAGIVLMFRILPEQLRAGRGPGLLLRRRRGAGHRESGLRRRPDHPHPAHRQRRPGGAGRGGGQRLQPGRRADPQQRGGPVRVAQALRGAQGRVAAELRRAAAPEPAVRRDQGGLRVRAQPAGHPRPRRDRRLRVLRPEPRLGRSARHQRGGTGLPRQGAAAAGARRRQHDLPRLDAAALRRPRPQSGRGARRRGAGCVPDHAELLRLVGGRAVQPVQPRLVGRACRPMASTASTRTTSTASTCARARARWCRCRR